MATNTTPVTGTVVAPDGTTLTGGAVTFQLNDWDIDRTTDEVMTRKPITAVISSSGEISVDLWPNEAGTKGTVYQVTLSYAEAAGTATYRLKDIQVPDSAGEDINDLLYSPPAASGSYWQSITEAEYDAALAAVAAAAAAQAAAEAAAAGVNLPSIQAGDAGKILEVKATEDGYELTNTPTFSGLTVNGTIGGTSVTASDTDTTAGRLTKVGDFGWGLNGSGIFLSNADASDMPSGTYITTSGTSGTLPVANGVLTAERRGATSLIQTFKPTAPASSVGDLYIRYIDGASVGDWLQINEVSGSNANGSYIRFSDGTQICWNVGVYVTANPTTWTFPAAFFATAPTVSLTNNSSSNFRVYGGAAGATSVNINCFNASGVAATGYAFAQAIGSWK